MKAWASPSFRKFALDLNQLIIAWGPKPKKADFDRIQQEQVEEMIKAEELFRKALVKTKLGDQVYQKFLDFIIKKKKNILAARPYFRERQTSYKDTIALGLKTGDHRKLFGSHVNYQFIQFAVNTGLLTPNLKKLAKKAETARRKLIELNMPLALSRVRIFGKNKPAKHLDYMDMVQSAVEGLVAAIDKFVLPYSPVFRSVIIGRVTGQLIKDYSETMMHFYPSDKRKIYRANVARKQAGVTINQIANFVNLLEQDPDFTDANEIGSLLEAVDHVSLDTPIMMDDDSEEPGDFQAPESVQPDFKVENAELHDTLHSAIGKLTVFQKKLIQLKGI
jgi:RNA polymerase sigma factor (sigma-70 family)